MSPPSASEDSSGTRRTLRGRGTSERSSQGELPRLRDEIRAETPVRLLLHQDEATRLVDSPCRDEDVVGPERHRVVAAAFRESDAFVDEPASDPQSARRGLDEEEAQLRDTVTLRMPYDKDGGHALAIALGDPASLATRVEVFDEVRDDLRYKPLEA